MSCIEWDIILLPHSDYCQLFSWRYCTNRSTSLYFYEKGQLAWKLSDSYRNNYCIKSHESIYYHTTHSVPVIMATSFTTEALPRFHNIALNGIICWDDSPCPQLIKCLQKALQSYASLRFSETVIVRYTYAVKKLSKTSWCLYMAGSTKRRKYAL